LESYYIRDNFDNFDYSKNITLLNAIENSFSKLELKINYKITFNIYLKKRYQRTFNYIFNFIFNEYVSFEDSLGNILNYTKSDLRNIILNKNNIDFDELFNRKWKALLHLIEENFYEKKNLSYKDINNKKLNNYQIFYSALSVVFTNRIKKNIFIKLLYPYFDLKRGLFKEEAYFFENICYVKGYGIFSYTKNDAFHISLNNEGKEFDAKNMLYSIEKDVLTQLPFNLFNYISIYNMIILYMNLVAYSGIFNNNNLKWYMFKHINNFKNKNNLKLVSLLNIPLLNKFTKDNKCLIISQTYNPFKFNDFKFKHLKNQSDIDIYTHIFFKKGLINSDFSNGYKYKKDYLSPLHYYFYQIDYIETLEDEEDLFFRKLFLYVHLKSLYKLKESYFNMNCIFNSQNFRDIYDFLIKLKKENYSLYLYFLNTNNLKFFLNKTNPKILIKFIDFFNPNLINKYISFISKLENNFLILNNFSDKITNKELNLSSDILYLYKSAQCDSIAPPINIMLPYYSKEQEMVTLNIVNDITLFYKEKRYSQFIYNKLYDINEFKPIAMFLIKEKIGFLKNLNNFIIKYRVSKKNQYILFLLFSLNVKYDNNDFYDDDMDFLFLILNKLIELKDKSIFDIFLHIFHILYSEFVKTDTHSKFDFYLHNFLNVFSLQIILKILETTYYTTKNKEYILKKILVFVKKDTSLTLFSNLYFVKKLHDSIHTNKFLKEIIDNSKNLKTFYQNLLENQTGYKNMLEIFNKNGIQNDILLQIIKSQDAIDDVLSFFDKYIYNEDLVLSNNIIDGLCVEVRGDKDLIGFLGSNVSGVCISTTSDDRYSHMNKGYLNLIIRDNENIYLWGLLIKGKVILTETNIFDSYLLNNLQGSVPSHYKKYKKEISNTIIKTLKELSKTFNHFVYSGNQEFNSFKIDFKNNPTNMKFIIDKDVRMDFNYSNLYNLNINKELIKDKDIIQGEVSKIV